MDNSTIEALLFAALSNKGDSGSGSGVPTSLINRVNQNTADIATLNGTGDGSISKKVADAIALLVANAPDDLDTLEEIADYIASDKTGAANMLSQISANTSAIHGIDSKLDQFEADMDELELAIKNAFDNLTPEQKASLKGDKGDKGDPGEKGEKGDKGDPGTGGNGFVAIYGTTTAQEIIAYLESGSPMPMFVERSGSYYTVTTATKQEDNKVIIHSFATISGNYYMFMYTITDGTWASSNIGFQQLLASGQNIKTINGNSLLGGGNLNIGDGSGTSDYAALQNKPLIEGHTVEGNKSAEDYNLASHTYVDTQLGNVEALLQSI